MFCRKECLFTDGSCMPNPGPGGAAAFCPQEDSISIKYTNPYPTTINHTEIIAS